MELVWGGDRESASTCLLSKRRGKQAIIRVFKDIQEDKHVVEVITNLKIFGEWVKWEAAMQLDWRWHSLLAYQTDNQLEIQTVSH